MKVTEKKLADGRYELTAVAATAEVAQAFNVAHYSFLANMGVQVGPGQTPEKVAEEELGIVNLDMVSQQLAVDYLVPFAVDKRNLCPAYPPKPILEGNMIKRGETFEFKLRVTPKPEYELTSYDPVTITVPAFKFDEAQVDQQVRQVLESYATYVRCDPHPLGENDAARIKVEAVQGGQPHKNLSTEGRTYIMGMNLLPEGFEKNLIGMTEGDTKTFSFDVPGAEEGAEPIECTVTVLECQCKEVPELTDEWVTKNIPMVRDAAALRGSIRESLLAEQQAQYREMQLSLAADELGSRFTGKIDDEVYEAMRETLMQNVKGSLAQQGVQFDEFVAMQGGIQQFSMMLMVQARHMLVQGYSLDALFRHENMDLTDEDILTACRAMNPADPTTVRRQMEGNGQGFVLRETAGRLKANRWLLEHANVVVEDQQPAPAAEEAPKAE